MTTETLDRRSKERLLKLASLLEDHKNERANLTSPIDTFDIEHWHCGTAACAVGFAMLHPWFRRRGLKEIEDLRELRPSYRGQSHFWAAADFFGIGLMDAELLFSEIGYTDRRTVSITPKMVAKAIRKFVGCYE